MEWLFTLLGILSGVVGHRLVDNWLKLKRGGVELAAEERLGVEAEWQRDADRKREEIAENRAELISLRRELDRMRTSNVKCMEEHAESRAEIKIMRHQIDQLQKMSLSTIISTTTTITADADTGVIVDADDSVKDVLGWRPNELKGENVDVVIPRRIRGKHHAGLERARLSGVARPPGVAIQTFALTKDKREIPVIVSLNEWRDEKGKRFISGQIIHRRIFESVQDDINSNGGTELVHPILPPNMGGSGILRDVK